MIKNEFEDIKGAMAKAACKRDACFVIHPLDHGTVILSLGKEVVEQKILVGAKHAGDLFHGLETRTHGSCSPSFHISGRPSRIAVLPESAEAFLELPCTGGCAERCEHGVEFVARLAANLGAAPQQEETSTLGAGTLFLGAQAGLLTAPHGVHCLVEMPGDVERIEHIEGAAAELGNYFEVGFPHVRTHNAQAREEAGVEFLKVNESFSQGRFGSALTDPEESTRTLVDLIDKSQEVERIFAASVVEFVDAGCGDSGQVPMFEPPFDDPLHRAEHGIPTGREDFSRLFPRQAPCPAGEENHVGLSIRALAAVPWHHLHGRRTEHRTDHPAWRVVKIDRNVPERHVMPPPLWQLVVDAAGPAAAGTAALAARVGIENHIDVRIRLVQAVTDGFQNETGEVLHPAEECFNSELNGGCGVVCCVATPSNARGRHSQAHRSERNQKVLPRKTHTGLFAKPAVAVKRAGDINPGEINSGPKRPRFYATRPLDGGEEQATNNLHASNNRR